MTAINNKQTNIARRRLLTKLTLGGGAVYAAGNLPGSWIRPVVRGVLLPAHAETTGESVIYFSAELIDQGVTSAAPQRWYARLVNGLVDTSRAQPAFYSACGEVMGDQMQVTWQNFRNSRRFSGMLDLDGTPGVLQEIANNPGGDCGAVDGSNSASIQSIGDDSFTLYIDATNTEYLFIVPRANSCNMPDLDGNCGP